MKKFLLMACIAISMLGFSAQAVDTWDGSTDTDWSKDANGNYLIYTAEELAGLAKVVNEGDAKYQWSPVEYHYSYGNGKTFLLMDDIDLQAGANAGKVWEPVGSSAVPFRGILHSNPDAGRNYTIRNLVIDGSTSSYLGLVGYAIEAKFYDFNLYNVDITTNPGDSKAFFVGSVVGYSSAGTTIDNVHVGLYEEVISGVSTFHKTDTLTFDLNNVATAIAVEDSGKLFRKLKLVG
jgi:hypothetical protein